MREATVGEEGALKVAMRMAYICLRELSSTKLLTRGVSALQPGLTSTLSLIWGRWQVCWQSLMKRAID